MPLSFEQIAAEAMQLPPDQRSDLAEKLWLSIGRREAGEKAWQEEITARLAEIDAGDVETLPAEQVFAELHVRLH